MAGKLGKFQMTDFQYWKPEVTKKNHLGSIYQLQPQKATNLMVQLLAYQRGKTLDTYLSQFPVHEFEDNNEYWWDVIGSSRRNIPLVEARDENGNPMIINDTTITENTMIGAGTQPFYLVFAEDWFYDGEVIWGNLNEAYNFRILGDPVMEGTNAVYRCELMGGNTAGCPAERLQAGERFSVGYAPVEGGLSRKVGGIRHASSASMRNEFSTIRIHHKVSGDMLNAKLAVGIPIVREDGKKDVTNMWMHEVEWQLEMEFNEAKNNVMAFGVSNRNANGEYMNFGKSGEVIKTGAGLYEQMQVANTSYYNTFSIRMLEDALYELSAAKLDFGERHFVINTGERGAMLFHKAIMSEFSGWTPFTFEGTNLNVVSKVSSPLHTNAFSYNGGQFVAYKAPNGVTVELNVLPYYDDPVRNKIEHPLGGPAMSYRFDIMYIGTDKGEQNIFKCKIKGDNEYRKLVAA